MTLGRLTELWPSLWSFWLPVKSTSACQGLGQEACMTMSGFNTSSFYLLLNTVLLCGESSFVHLFFCWWTFGLFPFRAIMNNVALNGCVRVFVWVCYPFAWVLSQLIFIISLTGLESPQKHTSGCIYEGVSRTVLTEWGRSILNVPGIIPWAGGPVWMHRRSRQIPAFTFPIEAVWQPASHSCHGPK